MSNIAAYLLEYGILAIVLLLALGIIGLPIPDESIIIIAGILVAKGKLPFIPTLLAIYLGALLGITVSYILGYTLGYYLIERFGYLIRITPEKIELAKRWFKEVGKWVLFFGYFIIGIRHLSGFVAGLMKLSYMQFALFAYTGMLLWSSIIFSIGYAFTHNWKNQLSQISYIAISLAVFALISIYGYFFFKRKK